MTIIGLAEQTVDSEDLLRLMESAGNIFGLYSFQFVLNG
jgi:hypothetical protein